MRHHLLSILGYVVATFITQALSHFVVFVRHYAEVSYLKSEPVFGLGIAAMLIQGAVLSFTYERSSLHRRGLVGALIFAWLFGAVLVSYEALAEASKYAVPNIAAWISVETGVGALQFSLVGLFLGLAHRVSLGTPSTA